MRGSFAFAVRETVCNGRGDVVLVCFDLPGNREMPTILGQLRVLPKHWWEGSDAAGKKRDIGATTLEPPLGNDAYRIKEFVAGRPRNRAPGLPRAAAAIFQPARSLAQQRRFEVSVSLSRWITPSRKRWASAASMEKHGPRIEVVMQPLSDEAKLHPCPARSRWARRCLCVVQKTSPAFDLTEHATKSARAIRNLGHAVGDHRDRCPCPDHHCRRLVRDSMSYDDRKPNHNVGNAETVAKAGQT